MPIGVRGIKNEFFEIREVIEKVNINVIVEVIGVDGVVIIRILGWNITGTIKIQTIKML